jgi:hypothetical protein
MALQTGPVVLEWLAAPQQPQLALSKAFVECDRQELIRADPELAGIQFDSTQERLSGILAPACENLADMFDGC